MGFKVWLENNVVVNNITFIKPFNADEDTVLMGDIAKIDASFKQDVGFYLGKGGISQSGVPGRYENFQDFLKKGTPIEMPEVGVRDNHIYFINGRHRYSVFRDMGWKKLPFCVNPESVQIFQKLFI